MLVGVSFPTVALEIMRFATAPQYFHSLLYGGATLDPDKAVEQGLLDEVVEPVELLEQAVGVAGKLAALPPAAFALTKSQIRRPVLKRIREEGREFDAAVEKMWADPKTLAAIQDYVARTLKRS
jgi:enoyl-CoA hydratase